MEREHTGEWWQGLAEAAERLAQPLVDAIMSFAHSTDSVLDEWGVPGSREER